jgi:hypothetical protein
MPKQQHNSIVVTNMIYSFVCCNQSVVTIWQQDRVFATLCECIMLKMVHWAGETVSIAGETVRCGAAVAIALS